MEKELFYLLLLIGFISCSKDNGQDNNTSGGQNSNYNFEDLSTSENLLDSIRVLHTLSSIPDPYKFTYLSKNNLQYLKKITGFSATLMTDTFGYSNNHLTYYGVETSQVPNRAKFLYSNNNISRIYVYEDDYTNPQMRQLGSYITSNNGLPTILNYKYINSNLTRDSIVTIIKRNLLGDVDSVFTRSNSGFLKLELTFQYTSINNKLKSNANLKDLNYMFVYKPIDFDFYGIEGYQPDVLDYSFMDQIFYDVLFNSSLLPTKFNYYKSSSTLPFFLKYKFNVNNYPTSVSIGKTATFNQDINERVQLTYYKKP